MNCVHASRTVVLLPGLPPPEEHLKTDQWNQSLRGYIHTHWHLLKLQDRERGKKKKFCWSFCISPALESCSLFHDPAVLPTIAH